MTEWVGQAGVGRAAITRLAPPESDYQLVPETATDVLVYCQRSCSKQAALWNDFEHGEPGHSLTVSSALGG